MDDHESVESGPVYQGDPQLLSNRASLRHTIYWSFWMVGTVLIVLSWVDVVTPTVGWAGFGIAIVGSMLSKVRI